MSRLIDHRTYVNATVMTSGGASAGSTSARLSTHTDREINEAIRQILGWRKWGFMQRTGGGRTYASYETGTIALTPGSHLVTGTSTVWTKAYERGFFEVTPSGEESMRLRVKEVISNTSMRLEQSWPRASQTGLSYTLYQDRYPVPHSCQAILDGSVRIHGLQHPLFRIERPDLNYYISSQGWSIGGPYRWIDDAWSGGPLWANDISPSDSTVDVTSDSRTLTGTNMALDNALLLIDVAGDVLEGWPIRVMSVGVSNPNTIFDVTGANALTLLDKFRGATGTGLSYEVGAEGSRMIQFWPPPDTARIFAYMYWEAFLGLFNNNDVSPIPSQWDHLVNSLASARMLQQMKGGEAAREHASAQIRSYAQGLHDMAAWDHPNADAPGFLRDQGLNWEYFGIGQYEYPRFTGPAYWSAS